MKRIYVSIFAALLLTSAANLLFTSAANAQTSIKSTNRTYNTDDQTEIVNMEMNGVSYKMKTVKDEMTEFTVDGKIIPAANWSDYRSIINQIKEQVEKDKIQAKNDRAQAVRDRARAKLDQAQADRDREQAGKDREQAVKDREQATKDKEQAQKDREQAVKDRAQAGKDSEQAVRDRAQAQKDREQAEKDRAQAKLDRIQADKDRAEAAEDRKQMASLIDDLINDKIVPNKDGIEDMTISKNGMVVNGIQQPETVFKKYKEKYPRFAHLNYGKNGTYMSNSN
jgi:colicin import membrane protein